MNTAVCITVIVAFLLWYMVIGSVDCHRHCVACMKSYATCNSTSRTCKSNCFQKKTCPNSDDLCLATWVTTHTGLLLMFTDCFPRPPYSGHTKYTRYCEGKELNDTVTCLCSRNGCNRRVFRPPKAVAPAKQDVPRISGNVSTHHGTVKGNTPSESSASTPVFVCIASLAVLILVFLFVYGTGQRKTNANPAATIQSGTVSTANNQKQQKFILQRQLAHGRFGDVWNASFEGETVAVKLFSHWAAREYQNERDFFMNSRTDHSNILQFIAAGEGVLDGQTGEYQYWLVTEYCHKGSLRDYLKSHLLSWEETLVFLHSISSGVAYLHADWLSEKAKIPVAHRDLKSANILVKEDGTCVLADFDSATALNCAWAITNNQVGTYRYMSPEELDASVNLEVPDAFKQMDVYSMALVLWEVTSRCTLTGPCETYELPQFAVGGLEPGLDKMIKVVVQQNRRPPLNWKLNEGMETLCETIQDCWDSDPEARLTADCTRARITDLLSHTEKPTYLQIV